MDFFLSIIKSKCWKTLSYGVYPQWMFHKSTTMRNHDFCYSLYHSPCFQVYEYFHNYISKGTMLKFECIISS